VTLGARLEFRALLDSVLDAGQAAAIVSAVLVTIALSAAGGALLTS
jgi:hypothetical protein